MVLVIENCHLIIFGVVSDIITPSKSKSNFTLLADNRAFISNSKERYLAILQFYFPILLCA